MTLTIYFLRHGQTPMSRENNFCGSGLNPQLTTEGSEMAKEFGLAYKTLPWKKVYATPLIRTQLTADPLCTALGIKPEIRDGLSEISYGEWEGKTTDYVNEKFHDDYIRWTADPGWNAPTGGETAVTIATRALQVIEEIKDKVSDGNVLIVSHKATIRILMCSFLGIDVGRFRYRIACPVGSVSVVEFPRAGPMVKQLADRAHLNEKLKNLEGT